MDWKKAVKPASAVEGFAKAGARKPKSAVDVVAEAIDKQVELFDKPKEEGRRWFEVKGDNVGFTIRYANSPLKLVGEETNVVVPKAQFVEVMNAIKADVVKGAFKSQLDAAEERVRARSAKMAASRSSKKS
ncbi:hypothetical protein HT136_23245 [Novosphingobium profundi]|uniref:hypothetical protein n=1 Tax=Novosphingobium profundi TaxID=1774954 RepID=UPI001BD98DE7|nr:hypothetical protein [Novosphingobium profundi]MBT0671291.1 hypothetical protein [Novosphingobium profundi]